MLSENRSTKSSKRSGTIGVYYFARNAHTEKAQLETNIYPFIASADSSITQTYTAQRLTISHALHRSFVLFHSPQHNSKDFSLMMVYMCDWKAPMLNFMSGDPQCNDQFSGY